MSPARRRVEWTLPGEWVAEGLCAVLGWENWEGLPPQDQRAVCEACPVVEECAAWAGQYQWTDATVAGHSYDNYGIPRTRHRKPCETPDQKVKV